MLAGAAIGLQLYGLYRPAGPPEPGWFPGADKAAHLLGFAVPVFLVLCALTWYAGRRGASPSLRTVALVLTLFAGHAVLSEIIQSELYANRSGDPADVLADWLGVALGAAGFAGVRSTVLRRAVSGRVAASR
jgi:VanZ family protein